MSEQWPGPISMRELAELAEANVRALTRMLTPRLDALTTAPSVAVEGTNGSGEGNWPGEGVESGREAVTRGGSMTRIPRADLYHGAVGGDADDVEPAKRATTSWGAPLPEGAEAGADWWYVPAGADLVGVEAPPGTADAAHGCGAKFKGWCCSRHPAGARHQATGFTCVFAEWGITVGTTPTTPAIGDELTVEQLEALPVGARIVKAGWGLMEVDEGFLRCLCGTCCEQHADLEAGEGAFLHSLPNPEPEKPTWTPLQRISREEAEGLPLGCLVLNWETGEILDRQALGWVAPGIDDVWSSLKLFGDAHTYLILWHPDWAETEEAS